MELKTHIKLYLRETIDNWRYIDTIIFLVLLIIYSGLTNPCDRCIIEKDGVQMSCQQVYYPDYSQLEINRIVNENISFDNLNLTFES